MFNAFQDSLLVSWFLISFGSPEHSQEVSELPDSLGETAGGPVQGAWGGEWLSRSQARVGHP